MSFADAYLRRQEKLFDPPPPEPGLALSVVIPSYSEPDLPATLRSLLSCDRPRGAVEALVVANWPQDAPAAVVDENRAQLEALTRFAAAHSRPGFQIIALPLGGVRRKFAGAGYARKAGMDEATRRFAAAATPGGVIVSLDADTTVTANYLTELERTFAQPGARQAVVAFEHPLASLDAAHRSAIARYELYLRYHRLAMARAGWPWPYHTVGSAFAVRADVYAEQMGMSRRAAGEDFYFLNKLFPLGGTREVTRARVFPSARLSSRVPFGTGAAVRDIVAGGGSYTVYALESYDALRYFAARRGDLFRRAEPQAFVDTAPEPLREFWRAEGAAGRFAQCAAGCASAATFEGRVWRVFDAFQVVKYLNFAAARYFPKGDVVREFQKLATRLADEPWRKTAVIGDNVRIPAPSCTVSAQNDDGDTGTDIAVAALAEARRLDGLA